MQAQTIVNKELFSNKYQKKRGEKVGYLSLFSVVSHDSFMGLHENPPPYWFPPKCST